MKRRTDTLLGAFMIALVCATLAVVATQAVQLPQAPATQLGDGDKCEEGKDCTCGNVTCNVGCTCQMTGPTGICTNCPIPEVPPSVNWPTIIAVAVLAVGGLLVFRRMTKKPTG